MQVFQYLSWLPMGLARPLSRLFFWFLNFFKSPPTPYRALRRSFSIVTYRRLATGLTFFFIKAFPVPGGLAARLLHWFLSSRLVGIILGFFFFISKKYFHPSPIPYYLSQGIFFFKRVIVTPAVYLRLVEFLHFNIQSTGQKSHCVIIYENYRNAMF
jgi:hypothetical protein